MNILQAYTSILSSFLHSGGKTLSPYAQFFLDLLSGKQSKNTIENERICVFLTEAYHSIVKEIETLSPEKQQALVQLATMVPNTDSKSSPSTQSFEQIFSGHTARELLWKVFSDEAYSLLQASGSKETPSGIIEQNDALIQTLRKKRGVKILSPNSTPLTHPEEQILFTSNILLCPPLSDTPHLKKLPAHIVQKAKDIAANEPQLYWYDHPMPIGVEPQANEMLYGLQGLSNMMAYEKSEGHISNDSTMQVVLSVSVTHAGLSDIAQAYLQFELDNAGAFPSLDIFIITETTTQNIANILDKTLENTDENSDDTKSIGTVFGVNGRYGRHYSFLKAIAPLWQLAVNKKTKATFKIDLDQIFAQDILEKETGKSALEHFKTALWGATAKDSEGDTITLGMIAGALVNESDIDKGLFTPDVAIPNEPLSPMDVLFPKVPMMAISTRAEMMTRYDNDGAYDGNRRALQRVHVTGGTNGILISSLKNHRPFTPSFIGRAEDQAYLMSVYNTTDTKTNTKLRYLHEAGLIMRHDKAAFVGEAIKAAKLGTYAGDLLRTLLFSRYAKILPGGLNAFKQLFAPFTSVFSTDIPVTSIISRLLLHTQNMDDETATMQLHIAADSLQEELQSKEREEWIHQQFTQEKQTWDNFYDSIALLEKNETIHQESIQTIQSILLQCRLNKN